MADFTREEVIEVVSNGRKCAGADLWDIDLSSADLREANLAGANLTGARYDVYTIWPEGFGPEAARAELLED